MNGSKSTTNSVRGGLACVLTAAICMTTTAVSAAPKSRSERAASDARILNGYEVKKGTAPWAVSLRKDDRHLCGASLVSPQLDGADVTGWNSDDPRPVWAITAAHCVVSSDGKITPAEALDILGGTLSIEQSDNDKGEVQKVLDVIVHKNYNLNTLENDIALLKLSYPTKDLKINRRSVRLPRVTDGVWLNQPYVALYTAGWGRTETGFASATLQEVLLPRVEKSACRAKYEPYGDYIGPGMICAGFVSGEYDSCQGDSGGSLFYRPAQNGSVVARSPEAILVGVVSWGRGCGNAELFGIYSSVSTYSDWVEDQIEQKLSQ